MSIDSCFYSISQRIIDTIGDDIHMHNIIDVINHVIDTRCSMSFIRLTET